nr:peroxiredoxin-like family protein [Candidatus Sigynarchaeota archaeon]
MAKLEIGIEAPDLKGSSVTKTGDFDLKKSMKAKPVVVVFSRYFGCPACQADFDELVEVKDKLAKKATIVYITQSTKSSAEKFLSDKKGVDFSILCDPEKPYPLYKAWGVGKVGISTLPKLIKKAKASKHEHGPKEGDEAQSPADFVVGTDGKLVYVNYSLLDIGKLLELVEKL